MLWNYIPAEILSIGTSLGAYSVPVIEKANFFLKPV